MTLGLTPGVYVEEVSGPGAIEGVPTWGAAFLGHMCQDLPAVPTLVTSKNDFTVKFGTPFWGAYLHWAVSNFFDNGGLYCWVLGVTPADEGVKASVGFTDNTSTTTFEAASSGTWANWLWLGVGENPRNPDATLPGGLTIITVCVRDKDINPLLQKAATNDTNSLWAFVQANQNTIDSFVVDISDTDKSEKLYILESFAGLSLSSADDFYKRINGNSSFIRFSTTFDQKSFGGSIAKGWYLLGNSSGAGGGNTVKYTAGVDPTITANEYTDALNTLAGVQGVSTISTPDIVAIIDQTGDNQKNPFETITSIVSAVVSACQGKYWFYVADPPILLTAEETVDFKNGTYKEAQVGTAIASSTVALYWPYVTVAHPRTGKFFSVPPSGAVLGRFAYTDLTVGVHQAAAGVNYGALSSVLSLATDEVITDTLQDYVYPQGLNVIRNRIHYGICLWGCRTLSYDLNWEHIPVRRFFDYVEKSLIEGLQQFVFDVNNIHLWVQVTREVTAFLLQLWQNGALFGRTQDEAFRVTCDETNNTQATMQEGYLYVTVEIAPVHPAEFIVIQVSQKMASA